MMTSLRHAIVVAAAVSWSPVPCVGQVDPEVGTSKDIGEVREVQHKWLTAYIRGDTVAIRKLAAASIRVAHSNGRILHHAEVLSEASQHATDSVLIADSDIVIHDNVAVASSRVMEVEAGATTSFRVVDTFIRQKTGWLLLSSHWARLRKARVTASIDENDLDRYVGIYLPAPGISFKVTRQGSTLQVIPPDHSDGGWGPFVPVSESTFYWRASFGDVAAHFVRDTSGHLVGLDLLIDGEDIIMTREGARRAF